MGRIRTPRGLGFLRAGLSAAPPGAEKQAEAAATEAAAPSEPEVTARDVLSGARLMKASARARRR